MKYYCFHIVFNLQQNPGKTGQYQVFPFSVFQHLFISTINNHLLFISTYVFFSTKDVPLFNALQRRYMESRDTFETVPVALSTQWAHCCVRVASRTRSLCSVQVVAAVAAVHAEVCKVVMLVFNVGSAMQVCTQPQICDERPQWELRPYLTHGERLHPQSHAPSFLLFLSASKEEGAAWQGMGTTKVEGGRLRLEKRSERREGGAIRNRKQSFSWRVCRCSRMPLSTLTPDTNMTPQLPSPPSLELHPYHTPLKLQYYHMYWSFLPLIMLITCPAPAVPKMGVFSSRLAPNSACPWLEVYIHTLLNGQILPRCCLHSTLFNASGIRE